MDKPYQIPSRRLHEDRRLSELEKAIKSRLDEGVLILPELIEEYNDLIKNK